MSSKNSRALCVFILSEALINGLSLNEAFTKHLNPASIPRDAALIKEICFGTLRWYFRLCFFARQLLSKPLKSQDQDIFLLILIGLYQLSAMRIPEHASVSETVAATLVLKKPWARSLVNAVLRSYQRQSLSLQNLMLQDEVAHYAHPEWLITALKKAWPQQWEVILTTNNEHPPFSLRVNQRHQSRERYMEKLAALGLTATPHPYNTTGVTLSSAVDVYTLPGFAEGDVFIQDEAAQLAASLLELAPGQRVLDACAAPGGKTTHLLETQPELASLLAIDTDAERLTLIEENLKRLRLSATLLQGDATKPEAWWDGELFDRILIDAPCSATGVIRRHPDIKIHRRVTDIPTLAEKQKHLLNALWPLLKPGGLLVYATCSLLPDENERVLCHFMQQQPDAKEKIIHEPWGHACVVGKQIFPDNEGMDGFYYGRLEKQ